MAVQTIAEPPEGRNGINEAHAIVTKNGRSQKLCDKHHAMLAREGGGYTWTPCELQRCGMLVCEKLSKDGL